MSNKDIVWPTGESKMGRLIYARDWSETSLGAISDWPQSLHAALNMCLISNSPISICWGEELIFLYNDAWSEIHGDNHSADLGQPARKVFGDYWEYFQPGFEQVLSRGKVAEAKNMHISLGNGEYFLDFSFSPIPDEKGSVGGIFGIATKTAGHAPVERNLNRDDRETSDFYENNFIGFHWVGPDGVILKANPTVLTMLGYSRDEFVGHHISDFHADKDAADKILQKSTANEELHDYECRMQCKDGSIRHVLVSSDVNREKGELIHTRCFIRDITHRKHAGAELMRKVADSEQNALLSAIVKSSDDAIISKDLNSIITSWNKGAERIFGYTAEEAVGRPITMLFPEDRIDEEEEIIGRIKEGKRVDHYETVRKRKNGTLLDVSLTISPVRGSDGIIVGASKIARDITEQKQAENQLRRNRNRLRTVLEIGTVGVVFWGGDDFTITEMNDAFLEMTGLTREEALGKDWRELTPEEFYPVSKNAVADLKETGHTEPYEKQYIRKDGSRWWGLSAPRRIDDNEVVEFLLDITERKEAEEELKEINETLEERVEERTEALLSYQDQLRSLASQLSKAEEQERQRLATELHDNLGQMLTLSKMKVDMLQKKHLPEDVASDINRLQELMDDALTYTRKLMSDLKPPPSLEGEDLRASIRWIAKQMQKHDLEVTLKDDERPKPVDEEVKITLLQCVRELLFNVLKHTSEKEAAIDLRRIDDYLQITVTDKGEGFETEDKELSPDRQGGFGLFNIRERIDLLGGRFEIKSEPGGGTEVMLHIPLKEKDQVTEAIEQTKETEQIRDIRQRKDVGKGIKVLLADDHQMVREGLRKIIEDHEDIIVVAEAADGKEAMELARETSPDVILMDVNMPVMDGIEATRKIIAEMPDVHIIGLSLHDDEGVISDMRSAGASAYLTKTEALESLIVTVRSEAAAPKGKQ